MFNCKEREKKKANKQNVSIKKYKITQKQQANESNKKQQTNESNNHD